MKTANSFGVLFISEQNVFGLGLINHCGSDVTAAGVSVIMLHSANAMLGLLNTRLRIT